MTLPIDPEARLIRLALAPDAAAAPRSGLLAAIQADVARTPQQRGLRLPGVGWVGLQRPASFARLAAVAALLLTLAAWLYLLGQQRSLPLVNGDVYFVRHGDVWRIGPDGGTPSLIAETPAREEYAPIWSPSGDLAAMVTIGADGSIAIEVMDPSGANRRVLVSTPEYLPSAFDDPVWSPDGRRIAFVEERNGFMKIAIVELESGEIRILDWVDDPLVGPRWSPDGRWIAAVTPGGTGSQTRVHLLSPDRDESVELLEARGILWGLQWMPDSGSLVYSLDGGDFKDIYRATLDGAVDLLTPNGSRAIGAILSPDGTRIAYAEWQGEICSSQTWVMDIDGRNRHHLLDHAWPGGWSPDGDWIFAQTAVPRDPLEGGLYALRADGSDRRLLVPWTEADVSMHVAGGACTRLTPGLGGIGWRGRSR